MVSREWLVSWLFGHLSEAQANPDLPVRTLAEEMSDEVITTWLTGEARWWRLAADKDGLTLAQRTMRSRVAMFYDERLRAHLALSPTEEVPDGGPGPDSELRVTDST